MHALIIRVICAFRAFERQITRLVTDILRASKTFFFFLSPVESENKTQLYNNDCQLKIFNDEQFTSKMRSFNKKLLLITLLNSADTFRSELPYSKLRSRKYT